MTPPPDETLLAVAERAMEDLAFLLPVPADSPPAVPPDAVTAAVAFEGPICGTLVLRVSPEMLPALAANMLGLDPGAPPSADQQQDALKELANVVCGNLLPALAGAEPVFNVRAPVLAVPGADAAPPPGAAPAAVARLALDVGTAEVLLYADLPVGAAPPTP